mgnify:FL=1
MKASLSSQEFPSVYNNSFIIKTPEVFYRVSKEDSFGIGFVLSRKLGPAFKRNQFKRRLRFLYRELFIKKKKKISMIIIPKTINLSWLDIQHSFGLMNKKINDI